ncbi:MAG: 2-hydroxyacyl-CoA dehydratase subunit D [Promethearchaeota archaeon]
MSKINEELLYFDVGDLFAELNEYILEQKAEGKKVIAFLSHEFLPVELIEAAGAVPLPLIFAGDEDKMTAGGDLLNPNVCSYARSILGYFKENAEYGNYRFLSKVDGVISTNFCTSNILIPEAIIKNFGNHGRDEEIRNFEFFMPYLQRPKHILYYKEQLDQLYKNLLEFTGNSHNPQDFKDTIVKYTKFKQTLVDLYKHEISGVDQLKIIQKALLFGPNYIDLKSIEDVPKRDFKKVNNKVILSGCAPFIGDNIVELIEEGGGNVVYNNTWIGNLIEYSIIDTNKINGSINIKEQVINALGENFRNHSASSHCIPNFQDYYVKELYKISERVGTKAVINLIIKFCDEIGMERQDIKDKAADLGLKMLNLEKDYSQEIMGQLRTRIEAFIEML